MNNLRTPGICLHLINELYEHKSWCGETHIQKTAYFWQTVSATNPGDAGWNFVLYKHGPYSFDLHSWIEKLRHLGLLELEIQAPYGPRIKLSSLGKEVLNDTQLKQQISDLQAGITKAAKLLSSGTVRSLERVGTALLLMRQEPGKNDEAIAELLHEKKPHVSLVEAREAITQCRELEMLYATS